MEEDGSAVKRTMVALQRKGESSNSSLFFKRFLIQSTKLKKMKKNSRILLSYLGSHFL
jgi:hypothetical protein